MQVYFKKTDSPTPALLPGHRTENTNKNKHMNSAATTNHAQRIHTHSSFWLTWVCPGLTEAYFDPILSHWCRHYLVDLPTYFLLDITVSDTRSCDTGVVGSRPVQIDRVVMDLRAQRPPVHPQGVVGATIELEVCWTTGTYENSFFSFTVSKRHAWIFECVYVDMDFSSLDENPRYLHSDLCPVLLMASRLTL